MMSLAHATTGAFIATKVANPFLAIPLIFFSHYLEDWIPHWDVGTGLSTGKRKKSTAILLEFVDLAVTAVIIYYFWRTSSVEVMISVWGGAFVGLLPDFMEAPRNFLGREPFFLKPFNEVHNWFHHSIPNMVVGIIPQIITLVAIYLLK